MSDTISTAMIGLRCSHTARFAPVSATEIFEVAPTRTVNGLQQTVVTPTVFFGATPVQPVFSGLAPGYSSITLINPSADAPAFLFIADETPLHQKLGVFERRS